MRQTLTVSQFFSGLLASCHLFSMTLISVHLVLTPINSLFMFSTQGSFYREKFFHREPFTQTTFKQIRQSNLLHRSFYAEDLSEKESFTHRSSCTDNCFTKQVSRRARLYTQKLSRKDSFYTQSAFRHNEMLNPHSGRKRKKQSATKAP